MKVSLLRQVEVIRRILELKCNQSLCRVNKRCLAIKLSLFSDIMQTKYNSKEFSERKLILARAVKFVYLKGDLVSWEF